MPDQIAPPDSSTTVGVGVKASGSGQGWQAPAGLTQPAATDFVVNDAGIVIVLTILIIIIGVVVWALWKRRLSRPSSSKH